MELRDVRGLTVECQSVQAHLGRRPIRPRSSRQCAQDRFGPPAYSRLALYSVDTATVAGYECRPAFGIGDALLDFVDQPVQRPVAAVAHEMGDPRIELLYDLAEVLDGDGFMNLAPRADNATQFGGAITRSAILACEGIDDDT